MSHMSLRTVMQNTVMAKIDLKKAQLIHRAEREFVNRNEEHSAFFGGNLIGVNQAKYLTKDREYWLSEIAEADELEIEDGIDALVKHVNDPRIIDKAWIRANDPVNLTSVYVAHLFMNDRKLPQHVRERAAIDTFKLLMYKYITSIISHWFPYPPDEQVMQATYAELSRKFEIKRHGSWNAYFESKASDLITLRSIHYKTLMSFEDTKAVIYMVTDIQARLKEVIKAITTVFYKVREEGGRIGIDKSVNDFDGESVVADKSRNFSTYVNYIQDIVDDRQSFIKSELVKVITDAMHTVPPKLVVQGLEWMSLNYHARGNEYLEKTITDLLVHAFGVISSDRALYGKSSGLVPLITRLRALYMASRMADPDLISIRVRMDRLVKSGVRTKNAALASGVRTAIQLYVVLRAITKNHYQQ